MERHPLEVLKNLGLVESIGLAQIIAKERSYESIHIGHHDVQLSKLLPAMAMEKSVKAPRTGHLGNWGEILAGFAGALDFNHSICEPSYGYPLVYCFTQTEGYVDGQRQGDWVYSPGSVVEHGNKRQLPLWTFESDRFVPRSRDAAWFCPFVMTDMDGTRVPLIEYHMRQWLDHMGSHPVLEAQIIASNVEIVTNILTVLIESAAHRDNSRRAFQDILSHTVTLSGKMERANIRKDGQGYWLEDFYYSSTKALVEAALIPFFAVAAPSNTLQNMRHFPASIPLMSHLVVSVLSAILGTHDIQGSMSKKPFIAHLHWGARDMAGYPPSRHGYLVQKATIKSMRGMCDTIRANFSEISPLVIFLLPASMFMLCPLKTYPRDSECLAELFKLIDGHTDQATISGIVRRWLETSQEILSGYFLARFKPFSGVPDGLSRPDVWGTVEPQGFQSLTTRQACTIVGAIMEALCT